MSQHILTYCCGVQLLTEYELSHLHKIAQWNTVPLYIIFCYQNPHIYCTYFLLVQHPSQPKFLVPDLVPYC